MTIPLLLLDRMSDGAIPLEESDFLAKSQVKGLSGSTIRRILKAHEIDRPFTSEGGRTSRGSRPLAVELARILNEEVADVGLLTLDEAARIAVCQELQRRAVYRLKADYFDAMRLEVEFDLSKSNVALIGEILRVARASGGNAAGAVAQHLVGAALTFFVDHAIDNHSYTTADQQTSRAADFVAGDAAIHVTMAPGERLFSERCKANLRVDLRPIVLVPSASVMGARLLAANAEIEPRVVIQSVEDFVAIVLDIETQYASHSRRTGLAKLLATYNERVAEAETDRSIQIDVPASLSNKPIEPLKKSAE